MGKNQTSTTKSRPNAGKTSSTSKEVLDAKKSTKIGAKQNGGEKEAEGYTGIYRHMFKSLDIIWDIMPGYLGTIMATVMLFLAGSTLRGDWLFILVHFIKHFNTNETEISPLPEGFNNKPISEWTLADFRLQNLSSFIIGDFIVAYTMYFLVCGFLQWYFYIHLREKSVEWKCQPNKFLTPELERHEVILGSLNVGFGGLIFGTLACYIFNGGTSTIYFGWADYGWTWFIVSIPIHFLYQDAAAYYVHRFLHWPPIYKRFHKWHHYYKQPTAFSATAMHPAEFLFFQVFMLLPLFTVPLHASVYIGTLMYVYYYGLITHSGIELEPIFPWQTNVRYHDNHHQYFHVNFGFNTTIFDRFHGTMRQRDRVYNENIYGGKGIALNAASVELKKEHAREIAAENKLLLG